MYIVYIVSPQMHILELLLFVNLIPQHSQQLHYQCEKGIYEPKAGLRAFFLCEQGAVTLSWYGLLLITRDDSGIFF